MNNMFNASQEDLQRRQAHQRAQRRQINTSMNSPMAASLYSPVQTPVSDTPMDGSDALDNIVQNNHAEMHRRRSMPQPQQNQRQQTGYSNQMMSGGDDRRMSMVEFGNNDNQLRDYSFGGMMDSPTDPITPSYGAFNPNMTMPGTSTGFPQQSMVSNDFSTISPEMMGFAFSNMNMGSMGANASSMGMFDPSSMSGPMGTSTSLDGMPTEYNNMESGNNVNALRNSVNSSIGLGSSVGDVSGGQFSPLQQQAQPPINNGLNNYQPASVTPSTGQPSSSSTPSYQNPMSTPAQTTPENGGNSQPGGGLSSLASAMNPNGGLFGPAPPQAQKNIYSKSGFDMLRALWQVVNRKNAEVNLGAVDMSCAFVVCDVTLNDCPIIYVSDNFQNLTGYSQHEILGQNCRFLQAPDGKVEAGTKREFVDNGAVYNLKQKIADGKEVQQSLINYRKGGKPFLNLLTMIPIPWDTTDIRYIIGFQIDLVECPDAISSSKGPNGMEVNYKHSDIGQYIWTPPTSTQWEPENGQTLGVDDVSTLLQQYSPRGMVSDWHKQSWDKMLLENADDVVHVLSLKGLFLYLSPSCKRVLEYESPELVGNSISSICHPSDIVPVTRELKDTTNGSSVNIVFRIRRKQSGYTWFESHGSLFVEQGKGRKCIVLVGRKRPVFMLSRKSLESHGGIGDSELWTKLSTSGMFLFVSANVRSLLDLQPDGLVGTSIQDLMRKESRPEFGRSMEKARRGRVVTCKHEVQNRRGQVLQAHTILYPGDASEGQKPTFILAQTKLLKASSRSVVPSLQSSRQSSGGSGTSFNMMQNSGIATESNPGIVSAAGGANLVPGNQDKALESDDNIFDELKTTRCTSWQYELRQMEKVNRVLAEELHGLLANKKRRKRRKGVGNVVRDCANCHTRNTPEWRRGPSGQRDLCNSCGLRWAKQTGRVSPRNSSRGGNDTTSKKSNSPIHSSPLHREVPNGEGGSDQPSDADASTNSMNRSVSSSAVASTGTPGTTPTVISKGYSIPPPSQPMLEGTSGGEMSAIQEEREVSM